MTDFIQTYAKAQQSVVSLLSDVGTGLAESTGFVVTAGGRNFIMTAAHSVLLDQSVWGMDAVLLVDDGSKGCGLYRSSGNLDVPAGVSAITFRFVASDPTKGVFIDNVSLKAAGRVIFEDNFNRGSFDSAWSQGLGPPWIIVKGKGKLFSPAARSGALVGTSDHISTLILNQDLLEPTTLRFDYKLDCQGGFFIVGYCSGGNCANRVSRNITAYYAGCIHPLRVVGLDGKGDIALCLPTDGSNLDALPTLPLVADSRAVPIATPVAVIGNPLGIDPQSVATGVIRDNRYTLPFPQNVEAIFTALSGYAGNSGSPYILQNGRVVGMLTFGLGQDSLLNGGPSARILQQVMNTLAGQVSPQGTIEYKKPYLGLDLYAVDLSVVDQLSLPMTGTAPAVPPGGFFVLTVEADSPLNGIIQQADVILTLEDVADPASKKALGTFPGQSGPSEVTWFMNPQGKVNMDILRFNQSSGAWELRRVDNAMLRPFPVVKDIPLGQTFKHDVEGSNGKLNAVVRITHRLPEGTTKHKYYTLNRYI